jgi:hypothetical protein
VPERFRDRFFTPPVARALTSPAGIVAAGTGVAVGIVVGLPVVAAAGIGALAWAARVALAVPRRKGERIDPFALKDPWRAFTRDALQAQTRYRGAVRSAAEGPLRDRLAEIGDRIDDGVEECWRIAKRGAAMGDLVRQLDVGATRRELEAVQGSEAGSDGTVQALEAQLQSAERMQRVVAEAQNRLRLLNARLDEAVARAFELSANTTDAGQLGGLGSDVDGLVLEMEAMRQAMEEAGGTGTTGTAST